MKDLFIKAKNTLRDNRIFERFFIGATICCFITWLILLLKEGTTSEQFKVFFESTNDLFADMTNVVGWTSQRDVYNNAMYTPVGDKPYPALNYLIVYFFSRTIDMKPYLENEFFLNIYWNPRFMIIYLLFVIFTLVAFYQVVQQAKTGSGKVRAFMAMVVLFSSPMIYTVERGNFVLHSMICVFIFLLYYDSPDKWKRELALICLAIATALKVTPALLGILLLYDKKWKEVLHIIIYGLIFGLLPFLFFKGGFSNILTMLRNMKLNLQMYAASEGCTLYATYLYWDGKENVAVQEILKAVTYASCVLFLISIPFLKIRWQKWLAVLLVLLIAPSRSGQYCIIYLIPAMIVFFYEKEHNLSEWIVLILFILILNPIQGGVWRILDFHMGIVGLVAYMFVRCVVTIDKIVQKQYARWMIQ